MELIEKELMWKARDGEKTETVYFRELTAGDTLALAAGQKLRGNLSDGEVEIDLESQVRGGQMMVQRTLVTADEKQVYPKMIDLLKEDGRKMKALIRLAQATHKEVFEEEGDLGNA
ncbi:MAG: hypothetical protein M3Q42_10415 [Pseudomonadota bacterium]|nr:hypothetical protein [Pseudomonadota bacterium]